MKNMLVKRLASKKSKIPYNIWYRFKPDIFHVTIPFSLGTSLIKLFTETDIPCRDFQKDLEQH